MAFRTLGPWRILIIALLILSTADLSVGFAQFPMSTPEMVGLRSERLAQIESLVEEGIRTHHLPGCVVAVGRKGRIAYLEAFGSRQLLPEPQPMTVDTVFDMASITKPIATATSIMVLLEQGKIRLRDRISSYIPDFADSEFRSVTVRDLLTHQAGFTPDNALKDYLDGRQQAFNNIYRLEPKYAPTTRFVYSDVGFILLDDLIERQSGMNVHEFSQKHIFAPLRMDATGFRPSAELQQRAAATEQRDSQWMVGEVHDPRAYHMGGIAGHAGLFSTATDLAIYAQMLLNGGTYGSTRILAEPTVRLMTAPNMIVEGTKTSVRGLGWDMLSGYSSNRGENMSKLAIGHGGFTGTVIWIDPEYDLFYIFLSNRLHPTGSGSVNRLAGRIATLVMGAIDD